MNGVAAVSTKTGTTSPAEFGNACEELADANQEARREAVSELERKQESSGLNAEEQKALDKARGVGMTFSSAVSRLPVPEAAGSFTGCSSAVARDKIPGLAIEGGSSQQKNGLSKAIRMSHDDEHDHAKQEAGVLCDKSHVHPGGGAGAHAEPKIVNHLTNLAGAENMKGGSILFSIDWRSSKYGMSGMPCQHCYKMLCHAAKECDIRIFICDKDKKPTELSKEDCSSKFGYEDLCQRVDGGIRPGRGRI